MKKYLLTGSGFLLCLAALAQKPASKPAPKPVSKPVPAKTTATGGPKNETDSLSYAIGLSVASFYKQQGMGELNSSMVAKAINDSRAGKPLLNEEQANLVLMCHSNPRLCANVKEGEQFLAANRKNPNVKVTPSGLQYEVITQGTGVRPGPEDTVTVNYAGTLTNGTEFDNSYKRGQPISFPLNGVIRGWTEALQLMPAGSKYKLYIPYQLAYGLNDQGPIPGGSVLVFEVELLSVSKGK